MTLEKYMKGNVWKFGDNVNSDIILSPITYGSLEEMKECLFKEIYPNFSEKVKSGDIIIAGKNFGCGSTRASIPKSFELNEISAVIAKSFGRIFYWNLIYEGIPLIQHPNILEYFETGDVAEIDLGKYRVRNLTKGYGLDLPPINPIILDILEKCGLVKKLEAEYGQSKKV